MVTLDEILRQRREESERQTRSQSNTTQTTNQTESRTMDDILATGTSDNSNNDNTDTDSNDVFTSRNQMLAELNHRGLRYETHLPEDNNLEVNTGFVTFDSVLNDLYQKDPDAMLGRDSQLRIEELASQVIDYSNKVREEETFKKLGLFNSINDTETVSTKVSHTKITLDI